MMPLPTAARAPDGCDSYGGARREVMATLAEAASDELSAGLAALGDLPNHSVLRPTETGLVMVRGRMGGDGAPFNMGEATVTRATVQLASGPVGVSYALGRDAEKARLAALCDALWQDETCRDAIARHVLAPVRARLEAERAQKRARTAATRVEFFTMMRGED